MQGFKKQKTKITLKIKVLIHYLFKQQSVPYGKIIFSCLFAIWYKFASHNLEILEASYIFIASLYMFIKTKWISANLLASYSDQNLRHPRCLGTSCIYILCFWQQCLELIKIIR